MPLEKVQGVTCKHGGGLLLWEVSLTVTTEHSLCDLCLAGVKFAYPYYRMVLRQYEDVDIPRLVQQIEEVVN